MTDQAARIESERDPLARLGHIQLLRQLLATAEAEAVSHARAARLSWAAIGAELGITKQAAAKRHQTPAGSPSVPKQEQPDPAEVPPKSRRSNSWEVTTPRGRTLLRIRQSLKS